MSESWKLSLKRPTLHAEENAGRVRLRWPRSKALGGGYNHKTLSDTVRASDGSLDAQKVASLTEFVQIVHADLRDNGIDPRESIKKGPIGPRQSTATFTIADGLALYFDTRRGPLRNRARDTSDFVMMTSYRDKIISVLGGARRWSTLTSDTGVVELSQGLIPLFDGDSGFRSAQRTVKLFYSVAKWLRGQKLIPADAALQPSEILRPMRADWNEAGKKTDPTRPRYTPAEVSRLFKLEHRADVRIRRALLLAPGVRPSAILRMTRVSIDFTPSEGFHGQIVVPAHDRKRAYPTMVTDAIMTHLNEAWAERGDLHRLEAEYQAGTISDYSLFPNTRGKNKGDAIDGRQFRKLWKQYQDRIGVALVSGRQWYGLRRSAADSMESGEARNRALGWAPGSSIGDEVYTSPEERKRSVEASEMLADFRARAISGKLEGRTLRERIHDLVRSADDSELGALADALGVV